MKRLFALLLALVLLFSFAACDRSASSSGGEPPQSGAEEASAPEAINPADVTIALSMPTLSSDWMASFQETFFLKAQEAGVRVSLLDAGGSAQTQSEQISGLAAHDAGVLVVLPLTPSGLGPALQSAADAGVKVINADTRVDSADEQFVATFVAADFYSGGFTASTHLESVLPEGAAVVALIEPQSEVSSAFLMGLEDAFSFHNRPDLTVTSRETDLSFIAEQVEAAFAENPEIGAFACVNDSMAVACYEACVRLGHEDCVVIGIGGAPAAKQSIADGGLSGTLSYSPQSLAETAFEVALAHAMGSNVGSDVQILLEMISADNLDMQTIESWG